jgi:hypothetical protein
VVFAVGAGSLSLNAVILFVLLRNNFGERLVFYEELRFGDIVVLGSSHGV